MARRAIGIDGGGTHTRAVMVDAAGLICGRAMAGPGNYQRLGPAGLERLLVDVLGDLGIERRRPPPLALCLALAGAGRPDEQAEIVEQVRTGGWAEVVCAVSDARAALEGAHGGAPGLIVISGTGSIVLGKNAAGEEARAGGWGPLLGDEGSGYSLGLEALRAVCRARDGWGPDTSLGERLRQALGIGHWDEVVRQAYGGGMGREQIAGLGPQVFAAAAEGDSVAQGIVAVAGTALGYQVGAVARRLGMREEVELACVGGVFREVEALWPTLAAAAAERVGRLFRKAPRLPPVLGAVLLAWGQAGWPVEPGLVDRLSRAAFEMP